MISSAPVVQFQNITKRFPGVVALRGVCLEIMPGTCHGLVGENGAGKSTLGKILAGIYSPEEGSLLIEGKQVRFTSPRDALDAGIGMVHQELAFCENMTVAENLCLGDLPHRAGFVSKPDLFEQAGKQLARIGADVEVDRTLGHLPISQQQLVQIASAVGKGARILIFDEPTSSLSEIESRKLFELIHKLKQQGITSIYVSHRMEEVFALCDHLTVLRDGEVIGTKPASEIDEPSLVQMMIGRPFETYFPSHLEAQPGEELLRVEDFSSPGKFEGIHFSLRAGEILGLAGLVGAGRTEIAQALFGLDPLAQGKIWVQGKPVSIKHPGAAMKLGIGLIPEDRKRHGLVLSLSARQNISLPTLDQLSRLGWISQERDKELAKDYFDRLSVRAAGLDTPSAGLSGGNQQKLVIAKWLAAHCQILLIDEPTRGVDVGAKAEIHSLIDQLAQKGSGLLLISSELPEVINLSTRIIVLKGGKIAGEVIRKEATQETILRLMAGMES